MIYAIYISSILGFGLGAIAGFAWSVIYGKDLAPVLDFFKNRK